MVKLVFGIVCVVLGLLFGFITWLLISMSKDLRKVLLELAEHGPCTSIELKRRSKVKFYSMHAALWEGVDASLITTRYRVNSQRTAQIRGELKTPEYRLSTLGWQAVTRLRAGKQLKIDDSE